MKIAIISDSHDNLANLKKALGSLKKEGFRTLLHCGDICAPATLKEILNQFSGKVHIVFGNVDGDQFRMTKIETDFKGRLKVWGEFGEIKIGGKNIAFTHFPEFARGLALTKKHDLVFHGHTHKPWEEKIGKTKLVNPGNLAGIFYGPTFAIYDTRTNQLKLRILE